MSKLLAVAQALAVFIVPPSSGAARVARLQRDRCEHYAPRSVTLSGELTQVQKYGPPNYGENPKTDARVRVLVLKLPRTLNVCGDPTSDINTESEKNVREVQLVMSDSSAKHLVGRAVIATGTLFHSHTGHHYTKVLMNVSEIRKRP